MNPMDYLESIKRNFLTDSRINRHQILREYENVEKSYIRARLTLADESFLEFSEYIEHDLGDEIKITRYSYHWIDKDGKMLRRWDNTKHFPQLKNSPHHVHNGGSDGATSGKPVNIFEVLDEIASTINK